MTQPKTLYFLLLLSLAVPAQAQQQAAEQGSKATLSVKGVGSFYAKPDYATLRLDVVTNGPSLEDTARTHQDRATRALAALQDLKPQAIDIERSTFELRQEKLYPPRADLRTKEGKVPSPTFTAKTTFFLKTKAIDTLNGVVTTLAAAGLFENFSVHFGVADERAALNQARRRAISDARDQAAAYADSAELRLAEIIEITDGEATPSEADGVADLPLPRFVNIIPPATLEFNSTVKVSWRASPRS